MKEKVSIPFYKTFRDHCESGDIIGYKSGGIVGGGIKLVTGGDKPSGDDEDFTHVGMVVNLESVDVKLVIEATGEGVQPHLLSYSLHQHRGVEVALFKPRVPLTSSQKLAVAKQAALYLHRPYPVLQLGFIAIEKALPITKGKFSDDDRALVCTEVLERSYYIALGLKLDESTTQFGNVTPNRQVRSRHLEDTVLRFRWTDASAYNAQSDVGLEPAHVQI